MNDAETEPTQQPITMNTQTVTDSPTDADTTTPGNTDTDAGEQPDELPTRFDPVSALALATPEAVRDGHADEPLDQNGNTLGRYRQHGFLSNYEHAIGIDGRGMVAFYDMSAVDDGGRPVVQTALLGPGGSLRSLVESRPFNGARTAAEHVVETAAEYAPWRYVTETVAGDLRRMDSAGKRARRLTAGYIRAGDLSRRAAADDAQANYINHSSQMWADRVGGEAPDPGELIDRAIVLPWWNDKTVTAMFDEESTSLFIVAPGRQIITIYPTFDNLSPSLRHQLRAKLADDEDIYL